MGLLDQPPLDLAEARARLVGLRSRIRIRALIGLLLALAGAALILLGADRIGIPLLIGAGAAALLVALGRDDRRRLLVVLVAQDDAWSIDDVGRTAARLVSPVERRRLAGGLRRAAEAAVPRHAEFSLVDPFRATQANQRLQRLAAAIADETTPVTPPAAALCRRLLSEGLQSPLYNPNLADADLDRAIDRIEAALTP